MRAMASVTARTSTFARRSRVSTTHAALDLTFRFVVLISMGGTGAAGVHWSAGLGNACASDSAAGDGQARRRRRGGCAACVTPALSGGCERQEATGPVAWTSSGASACGLPRGKLALRRERERLARAWTAPNTRRVAWLLAASRDPPARGVAVVRVRGPRTHEGAHDDQRQRDRLHHPRHADYGRAPPHRRRRSPRWWFASRASSNAPCARTSSPGSRC
jgi:hypothetical protein